MTGGLPSLAAVVGTLLGSSILATGMAFLGINPVLSVLAATVIGVDILYYRRRTSVRTDAAMQELTDGRHSAGGPGSRRE